MRLNGGSGLVVPVLAVVFGVAMWWVAEVKWPQFSSEGGIDSDSISGVVAVLAV